MVDVAADDGIAWGCCVSMLVVLQVALGLAMKYRRGVLRLVATIMWYSDGRLVVLQEVVG